jgi:hypothetical protein
VLTVLSWGGSALPASSGRTALAEDIDCYNDKDLFDLPECVERRANDAKTGNQPSSNTASPPFAPTSSGGGGGTNQPSNSQTQPSGGDPGQQQQQQSSPPPQQQASNNPPQGGDEEEAEEKPRGPLTDPWQAVLTLQDAGKEATQYASEEGSDKYGRWAHTRYERDRSNSASTLGANVIDTKVWVAKDVESAKALFKEQAAIKNFPERKEPSQGPNEKAKAPKFGEESSFETGYYQDPDDKIYQHWRFTIRKGASVAVLYLFGREEFFMDRKDKTWTGQGEWYLIPLSERL